MERDAVEDVARGEGPYHVAGAREVFQLLTNPECATLGALLLSGHTPAEAAAVLTGEPVHDQGSPIAFAVGRQFEATLKKERSARVRRLYQERGRISDAEAAHVLDLVAEAPGDTPEARADRARLTREWVGRRAAADPAAPAFIWHARLNVRLGPIHLVVEPDLLTTDHGVALYMPGEVKALQERGYRTDRAALANARVQATLAVLGLRQLAAELGLPNPETSAPAAADLLLRRGQSMWPTLRSVRLTPELTQLGTTPAAVAAQVGLTLALIPPAMQLLSTAALDRLPIRYREGCRIHCALAQRCGIRARASADPAILGDTMAKELEGLPLSRVIALLRGDETPSTDSEERLLAELRATDVLLGLPLGGLRRAG